MLHGIKCRNCDGNRCEKPYITAYEIAVKHGFQGTEEEWINTIGCIYLARVTARGGTDWDCSNTYEELAEMLEFKEVHLLTLDGRIAFLNGVTDDMMIFCTANYETDAGTVYDKYELGKTTPGDAMQINVSNETGTITIDRLAPGIQTSLAKADTAYQKPAEGIKFEHLQQSVQEDIQTAPIIYISIVKSGNDYVVDFEHTDLHGYTTPMQALQYGADVRMQYSPTGIGNPYVTHPCIGAVNNNGALLFGGVEEYTDFDSYTQKIAFYAVDEQGTVDYYERPFMENNVSVDVVNYYDVVVTYDGSSFSCNKSFSDIKTAYASNKIMRFFYNTFLGTLVEVGENAIVFYALDATYLAAPAIYMIVITGSGITGLPLIS